MPASTTYPRYNTSPDSLTRPILFTVFCGVLTGIVLFFIGLFTTLPNDQQNEIMDNFLSVGDIFPGLAGFERGRIILVMGVDMPGQGMNQANSFEGVRTDTMMLVRLIPSQKRLNVVSLPRDSKVYLANGGGVNKLNAAFAIGGPDLAVQTVEESFGVTIDNYVVVNIGAVRKVVDAVGGIDIYVDQPMRYRDNTAKLFIDFDRGTHHLNGREAEGYIRFRHDALGDIGRIRRQQAFLQAFSKKIQGLDALFKLKPLLDAKDEFVLTDMGTPDLARLAVFAKEAGSDRIQVATLPGAPAYSGGVSYWVINRSMAEDVLNKMIMAIDDNPNERPTEENPISIGLIYTARQAESVPSIKEALEAQGYRVRCTMKVKASRSQFIAHEGVPSRNVLSDIKSLDAGLSNLQLIFSPHGSTFETSACGQTDYTLVLGNDIGSMAHQ